MIQRNIRSLKIISAKQKRRLEIDESIDLTSDRDETLPSSELDSSLEQSSDSGSPSAPKCPRIDKTIEISDDSD